jgi:antitoxin HicB
MRANPRDWRIEDVKPELPGCISDGETRAEALADVEDAIATWIYCARKAGEPIPEAQLHRAA